MLELNFSSFPKFQTERLFLERLTSAHLNDLFEIRSNPVTMRFIPRPVAKTTEDAQVLIDMIDEGINANEKINWGLFTKDTGKLIGVAGYVRVNKSNARAEVGYVLNSAYHQRGLMKEALDKILEYGFNTLNFNCIEAIIDPENIPSVRLIEKLDFMREGLLRDFTYHNEKFSDAFIFSKLKREFNHVQAQ
jgi:[ribosomal protein S5]-alanine N-acetyltransferase